MQSEREKERDPTPIKLSPHLLFGIFWLFSVLLMQEGAGSGRPRGRGLSGQLCNQYLAFECVDLGFGLGFGFRFGLFCCCLLRRWFFFMLSSLERVFVINVRYLKDLWRKVFIKMFNQSPGASRHFTIRDEVLDATVHGTLMISLYLSVN